MNSIIKTALVAGLAIAASGAAQAATYWVKDGVHLNARSGPSASYYRVYTFTPCTKLEVVGYQGGWSQVSYNNQLYWVSSKYLQDYRCGYQAPAPTYKQAPKTYAPKQKNNY
jgi:uncharacterized protein YraI